MKKFNTDILRYLHGCSDIAFIVAAAAACICLLYGLIRNKEVKKTVLTMVPVFVLFFYLVMVGYVTLFSRESGDTKSLYLKPLAYLFTDSPGQIAENLENFVLLLPMGILLPVLMHLYDKWYRHMWTGFGISLAIELTQLVTGRGHFQTDDIIYNGVGYVIGYMLVIFFMFFRKNKKKRLMKDKLV